MESQPIPVSIDDPEDPRLSVYRDLPRRSNLPRHSNASSGTSPFVVEGVLLVKRLIRSRHRIASVLIDAKRDLDIVQGLSGDVPIFRLQSDRIEELVGFSFHRGVMAAAIRPPLLPCDRLGSSTRDTTSPGISLALHAISDKENVGSMLRSAAAFGIHQILVGGGTVDPYSRRSVRVSMGAALEHTFFDFSSPVDQVRRLVESGFRVVASTLTSDAIELSDFRTDSRPTVLIMGNEAEGLPDDLQSLATERVSIPMHQSTDSLNVSVAAAIMMHELTRRR